MPAREGHLGGPDAPSGRRPRQPTSIVASNGHAESVFPGAGMTWFGWTKPNMGSERWLTGTLRFPQPAIRRCSSARTTPTVIP